jgi:hypothetical protein
MKRILSFSIKLCIFNASAQIPAGYYDDAAGLTGLL